MRNFTKSLYLLLISITLFVASCSPSVNSDYLNVLPDDVSALTSIDLQKILDKSQITENETLKSLILPQLKAVMPAKEYAKVSDVINNFSELGLDTNAPMVFAVDSNGNVMAVAKVSDIDKLKEGVELMTENKITDSAIEDAGDFEYVYDKGNYIMAFNSSVLVVKDISRRETIEQKVAELKADFARTLAPAAEGNFVSSTNFKNFWAKKGDIKFLGSTKISDSRQMAMATMFLPDYFGRNDEVTCIAGIRFEEGEAIVEIEPTFSNENLNGIVTDNFKTLKNISGDALSMLPSSAAGCAVLGLDGAKIAATIAESTKLSAFLSKSDIKKAEEYAMGLEGDLTLAITGFENDMPTFAVITKLQDAALIDLVSSFLGSARGVQIEKIDGQECAYKLYQRNFGELYYGINNGYGYASNSAELAEGVGTKVTNSLADAQMTENFDNGLFALCIDGEKALEFFKAANRSSRLHKLATLTLDPIDYAEVTVENKGKTTIKVVFDDKKTNSLQQIMNISIATAMQGGL